MHSEFHLSPTTKNKKAFALLISLFLMGFLVILVITLSAIVSMELKASKQVILDQKAKNAAKFAAYQALNEVQKSLGVDQRITANAKILDTEINEIFDDLENDEGYSFWKYDPEFDRDNVNSIEDIANPHWLGVWNSTPGYYPMPRANDEDRYTYSERILAYATNFLVSGNRAIKREAIVPTDELNLDYSPMDELTEEYVNMLRKNSITDENGEYNADTMRVRAPLVTIPKTDAMASKSYLETRIAWWVSDESQKAPVNVIASEEEFDIMNNDEQRVSLLQTLPFKNGMQALSLPNSETGFFNVDLNDSDDRDFVRRLNDVSQLDLLLSDESSSVSAAKFLYNSVSMNTRGLPVNVRSGGLKKDLSVGLLARNPETLRDNPDFFERPMGVEGYDAYLTNPLDGGTRKYNIFITNSAYNDKKGHMFGPQAVENIDLVYTGLTYTANDDNVDDVSDIHKDPGGPLWESLRDYYNNRVDKDGIDIYGSGGYANTVKTKTDVSTGLSPVLLHYQLFSYPTLTSYSGGHGVRIYIIPMVVLWNPYDIDIREGSTFAFSAGRGSPSPFGSYRVAVGTITDGIFEAIRDIRTETMPRPLPNAKANGMSYISNASFSEQATEDSLNLYRAVSLDAERIGIVSVTDDGMNDSTMVASGHIASRYPINKAYFGYGHWRYEDTKELVSGVEDSAYFPSSGDNGLDKSGLVRIYNKGTYSDQTLEMGTGDSKVSVNVPEYYYLSTDSFYYRKLYLNNVKYSISWAGQSYLGRDGAYIRTEDEFKTSMFTERAHPSEDPIRFLVKCEEALKGGEAKIFTLKESVPYHYKFNSGDGYAGVLAMADQKGWYLTEGVDKDSIGGLFIDIMHAERTHLASNKTTIGTSRILSYNIDDIKNIEFDPQTKCDYDGKELGVLFDLSDGRYYGYSDESEEGKTVSIDDIYIDIDHFSEEATGVPFRHYVTPWYMKAESAFNPNPWYRSGSSTPNTDDCLYLLRTYATDTHNFSLQFSDLMMWNYEEDDNDSSMGLYTREDGNDGIVGNIGAGAFQNLKRYVVVRSEFASPFTTSSFPDPIRVKNDAHSSNYQAYFYIQNSMVPFHSSTFGESPQIQHPANTASDSSEQYIFVGSNNSGTNYSSYDINQNYTSNADKETILTDFVDVLRDKVRGRSNPLLLSSGNTIYDGYYKSLMQEINFRIILDGVSNAIAIESNGRVTSVIYNGVIYTSASALYNAVSSKTTLSTGIYTDDDYETFLEDLDLYDKYAEKSWIWEDPYFLLRNPRRVAYPRWTTKGAQDSTTSRYLYWSDNIPKAVNVQSAQIVESTSTRGLSLDSELLANDGKSLMSYECVSAYRPMSEEIEADHGEDWFFQYPFKFPWLAQTNTTAKVYADGRYGNAGAFRDRSYGTDDSNLRGGSSENACSFFGYGAIGNNLQYSAAQYAGEKGTEGNFQMGELFAFYINKFGSRDDGQVQIGPDVLSEDSYKYTTKHYLRKYEVVASPADLSTADLVFGAEQSRNFGTGTATSDMYYPDNLIGSSYSPMRVSPERPYDYVWIDAVDTVSRTYITRYNSYGDGIRNTTAGSYTDEIRHVNYDIAWLLNDLLWDEYFFSSIPYTSYKQNDLDSYYEYLVPKNPRIEYINKYKDKIYTRIDNNSTVVLDNKIEGDDDLDYDFDANASRFWIKGAFNVNSTDVDAWKMVLGTSFGNPIYGFDGTNIDVDDKAPFPRNGAPYTAEEFDEDSVRYNENTAMQGFRALTRVELEELALSMVENIKDRGPFFSLADFMNRATELRSGEMRRMATDTGYYLYDFSNDIWDSPKDDWEDILKNADENNGLEEFYLRQAPMQKGVVQSAIDLTAINSAFFDDAYLVEYEDDDAALNSKYTKIVENDEYSLSYSVYGDSIDYTPELIEAFWADFGNPRNVWENYRAVLGSTLAGAPAYLTQVDIIKQIGSFITVRGDTFKIRAYGEIRNPLSEEIQSKAWCEMLIQRYPEYMDGSVNVPTDVNYREKELGYQGGRTEYDAILTQLEDSPVNMYLGRRFKIVSFKWLSEREI